MDVAATTRTPVHLWIVGIVSLLWNAFGAYDYLMTQMNNQWYLSDFMQLSEADQAYVNGFPAWADAAWAFGVWGAVLGSLLLLIRSRLAYWAFVVSLVGLFVATLYQHLVSPWPADMMTSENLALNLGIWAVALALLIYSYRMLVKGVLR